MIQLKKRKIHETQFKLKTQINTLKIKPPFFNLENIENFKEKRKTQLHLSIEKLHLRYLMAIYLFISKNSFSI